MPQAAAGHRSHAYGPAWRQLAEGPRRVRDETALRCFKRACCVAFRSCFTPVPTCQGPVIQARARAFLSKAFGPGLADEAAGREPQVRAQVSPGKVYLDFGLIAEVPLQAGKSWHGHASSNYCVIVCEHI